VAADAVVEMTVFAMGSLAGGVAFAVGGGAPVCALVAPPMTIHTAKNPSATANPAPTKRCHRRGAESDLLPANTTLRKEGFGSARAGPTWGARFLLSAFTGNPKRNRVS